MSQHPLQREPHPGGPMPVEEYQQLKYLYPNAKLQLTMDEVYADIDFSQPLPEG